MADQGTKEQKEIIDEKKEEQGDATFDMKECCDALKEPLNDNYAERLQSETYDYADRLQSENDNEHEKDIAINEEEDKEETSFTAEYDDEHMKELHSNMTDEQLEEEKDKASLLKNSGNEQYKNNYFLEAIDLYTEALNCCPLQFPTERSILYGNRSAALIGLDNKKKAVEDCSKALELNPNYVRVVLRRAQLYRKMENLDKSLEDYKKVLELDPNHNEARQACTVLPVEINERNEKLKAEMLDKLKDLGNLVLRPFGLSTDNFKMVQDPNTGGYSVNFQK